MPASPAVRGLRLDVTVTFDFNPSIGILARDINKLGMDIRSFREPLKRAIQQVMIPSIRQNFSAGGRPEPWEELSEVTEKFREDAGFPGSGPILVRKGTLQRNMGFLSIWQITPNFATIKELPPRIWYGKLHQSGFGGFGDLVKRVGLAAASTKVDQGGSPAVHIPQREFVLFQEEDKDHVYEVFSKWLAERALKSGKFIPTS